MKNKDANKIKEYLELNNIDLTDLLNQESETDKYIKSMSDIDLLNKKMNEKYQNSNELKQTKSDNNKLIEEMKCLKKTK